MRTTSPHDSVGTRDELKDYVTLAQQLSHHLKRILDNKRAIAENLTRTARSLRQIAQSSEIGVRDNAACTEGNSV